MRLGYSMMTQAFTHPSLLREERIPAGHIGLDRAAHVLVDGMRGNGAALLIPDYAPTSVQQRLLSLVTSGITLPPEAAVVCPTSGSTGNPRGVVISANNLLAAAASVEITLGQPAVWMTALPPATIASLTCIVRAQHGPVPAQTWSGAGGPFNVEEFLASAIDVLNIADAHGIPARVSVVSTQVAKLASHDATADVMARFQTLLVGGGPLSEKLHRSAVARGWNIVRTYGMTETTGGCIYDGCPLPNVEVLLSNGEVMIAAPQVALGYLDGPLPMSGRFLATGDMGYFNDAGRLVITGRKDNVVPIRGTNVDLDLVASVLQEHPGVEEAAVTARPHNIHGYELWAFIVGPASADALISYVAEHVGRQAIPHIRHLPALPSLPNGKVDRSALDDM